jgi:hypothetical protein
VKRRRAWASWSATAHLPPVLVLDFERIRTAANRRDGEFLKDALVPENHVLPPVAYDTHSKEPASAGSTLLSVDTVKDS